MMAGEEAFKEISQQEFLAGVREALGVTGDRLTPSPHSEPKRESATHGEYVRETQARLASRRMELVEQMDKMATTANWRVRRAIGEEEAIAQIAAIVEEVGAEEVALTDHSVLRRLSLAGELQERGVEVVVATTAEFDSRAAMHEQVNHCKLGITGVDYALAETGSCVLLPRRGVSRVVSLLPEYHLAVVDASQIVENFEELMALRRSSFLDDGKLSSYMSIVTGPSRTGDIEQTIVIGAHGPRQVHMLIVDI